jgi:guanylate kinase
LPNADLAYNKITVLMDPLFMTARIFVITGPSGVGKGTLCEALLRENPRLMLSISATSRPKRAHEQDAVNYHFKTRDAFEAMIAHDRTEQDCTRHHLLEWAEYNGNYYGTPRSAVEQALQSGKSVLLEIEVRGALVVKEKFPAACLIFITPPSLEELERRLRGRGTEDEASILNRLAISRDELALSERFDHVVVNADLDACLNSIRALMQGL